MKVSRVLVLIGILALASLMAYGQAISGDLVGLVVDKSGAAVPNATVDAVNEATGVKSSTKTNAAGEYRFTNLAVGKYSIAAAAQGFSTTTVRGVTIDLNRQNTAPKIAMNVGQVTTTVEVTETPAQIDTTTAQIQTTYDQKQLQDNPGASVGLGVLNLSLLQAGVASTGGLGAGTGPSVGGQRPRNNNFTVEGVDNNDKGVTGPLINVPNDAVANFTILQNQFSPEFGHSTGGQFNTVVQSGTNNFHGRLYEYFQNRNLNAIDNSVVLNTCGTSLGGACPPGVVPKNARFDNNRFGGQVGGPVIKNKLFFFANFEYNPIGQASQPNAITVPTAAGYQQLAAISGVNATIVNALASYATAPSAGASFFVQTLPYQQSLAGCPLDKATNTRPAGCVAIPVGNFAVQAPNFTNNRALVTSMDYNISSSDQLRGRYIYNKISTIDTAASLPTFFTPLVQPYHLVNLSEYHTFSPTVTNELRLGYNRTGYNYVVPTTGPNAQFPGQDMFPNITIDQANLNLGPDPNAPQYSTQNQYQLTDNVTWIKGTHTFKLGIEGRKWIAPQLFIQRLRGDYEWASFDAFAHDFVPDFAERSNGGLGYSGDQKAIYWYVNDTWKLKPNLSINLGVRYEYTGVPVGWERQALNDAASVPGLISFAKPVAPKHNFMPRLGFAWSPGTSGNTSIRGGFGMGYDVLYDNIGLLAVPPQVGSTIDCSNTTLGSNAGFGCSNTAFLANGGIPPASGGTGLTTFPTVADARAATANWLPPDVKYPYSIQWNFGVQHIFAKDYTFESRYVGTRGVHLNVQDRINIVPVVTPTRFLPTYLANPGTATLNSLPFALDCPTANANCTDANVLSNFDNVRPDFAAAGFTGPITGFGPWGSSTYHGWQNQLTRRFSNGLQFQVAYTWSHNIDNSTADFFSTITTPRRPQDFQCLSCDKSNSALDHRHRLTVTMVYDTPWFKNHSNWFMKNVLGNYELTPNYTYESGGWADIQSGVDSNMNGDSAGDRAIVNPNGTGNVGSGVTPLTNSAGQTVAYLASNPDAKYIVAGAGALSNMGRNTFQLKPINNWDLSMLKRINVTERYRFEFIAQFMNIFNHAQLIPGLVNQVNSVSVTSTADRNYLIPNKVNFANARLTWPSNARTAQLALKFIF